MSGFVLNPDDKTIAATAHGVLTELLAFINASGNVIGDDQTASFSSILREGIPQEGIDLDSVIALCSEAILPGAIRQSHPMYLAFPDSGNAVTGLIAEMYVAILNQNLIAVKKSAPTGTFVEIQVIRWLRELVGFEISDFPSDALSVSGIMVGGGVGGNAVALLAARSRAYPNVRREGLVGIRPRPAVFVAGDTLSHYSHLASAWWVGLGEDNVVPVDVDEDFTMSVKGLDRSLAAAHRDGRQCVAVIAQAGDSRTMSVDHLDEIADLAQMYGTWLHVDACHGGALLFSESRRTLLNGIARADSVVIDGHKALCLPYACSALLFRSPLDLQSMAKSTDITIQSGSYDLGQITPFAGSRRFDSLKLWMLLRHLGVKGIGRLVDGRFNLALYWKALVDLSPIFIALNDVTINSVVFSLRPTAAGVSVSPDCIGRLNQEIHDKVYSDGRCCIHCFDLCDAAGRSGFVQGTRLRVLGVTLGNPLTERHHLDDAFAIMSDIATDVLGVRC